MTIEPTFSYRTANGITLHVAEAGPLDGPLVILLHGFPEFWFGWRHQIRPLAEAGFRVLAPDQRGYHLSDKPPDVAAYNLESLAADVVGLIDSEGRARASLVGHDWGGVVAWWAAESFPDRVQRLGILNAPHPRVFRRLLPTHPRQLLKSWYTFAFQVPRLPEWSLRRRNWRALVRTLRRTSRPGTFTDDEIEAYRRAWSQPGAIRSMIHWYRASLRYPPPAREATIEAPTLLLWGVADRFLDRSVARPSLGPCRDGTLEFFETATHWLQHEEVARVNERLVAFLGRP